MEEEGALFPITDAEKRGGKKMKKRSTAWGGFQPGVYKKKKGHLHTSGRRERAALSACNDMA